MGVNKNDLSHINNQSMSNNKTYFFVLQLIFISRQVITGYYNIFSVLNVSKLIYMLVYSCIHIISLIFFKFENCNTV